MFEERSVLLGIRLQNSLSKPAHKQTFKSHNGYLGSWFLLCNHILNQEEKTPHERCILAPL